MYRSIEIYNNTTCLAPFQLRNMLTECYSLCYTIEQHDAFEYARLQRPSTNWFVEKI